MTQCPERKEIEFLKKNKNERKEKNEMGYWERTKGQLVMTSQE